MSGENFPNGEKCPGCDRVYGHTPDCRVAKFIEAAVQQALRGPVFTPEQVYNLNQYQIRGEFHPFTCGSGHRTEHPDKEGILVATIYGWICPYCDYRQDWAHGFMKEPRP